jgi:hypothetical protein
MDPGFTPSLSCRIWLLFWISWAQFQGTPWLSSARWVWVWLATSWPAPAARRQVASSASPPASRESVV